MRKETLKELGFLNLDKWYGEDKNITGYRLFSIDSVIQAVLVSGTKYGAAVICRPDILGEIAERFNCDLWILPSSIYEIFILLDIDKFDREELKQVIHDVNTTIVDSEERLSFEALRYIKNTGKYEF